jgi:hypothetical protein
VRVERVAASPVKYCLGCSYVIDLLPQNRCPECGRAFDPDDPATFAVAYAAKRRYRDFLRVPGIVMALLLLGLPLFAILICGFLRLISQLDAGP